MQNGPSSQQSSPPPVRRRTEDELPEGIRALKNRFSAASPATSSPSPQVQCQCSTAALIRICRPTCPTCQDCDSAEIPTTQQTCLSSIPQYSCIYKAQMSTHASCPIFVQPILLPKDVNPKAPPPLHFEVEYKPGSKFWPYKELKGQHKPVAQSKYTNFHDHIQHYQSCLRFTTCLLKHVMYVQAA